ncbi:spore germination protein YndE [Oxobacter pfennigii]|uniref:Spore germination protein YndE n=1 Tax=Oxobacter pfennigii TaxID=36849 RepID=A0A0P8YBT2_9CLOT|nr:endospore germination permease [Oxobacter pfennigii]KPU44550.1 spore germination protein YndE [Oxobacter pfennigii]
MSGKDKERISSVELWAAMCIHMISSAMIVPIGGLAGHQSWISAIIAVFLGSLYILVAAHLCDIHSGKSIIEISKSLLGKWVSKFIGLIYALYSFQGATFILRDHWQFTINVALPNTPVVVISASIMLLVIWIAYEGIESMARISILFFPIIIFYLIIAFILLGRDLNFQNLLPITGGDTRKILYSALQISTLPLSLGGIFVMIFPHLKDGKSTKTPSLLAVTTAGLFIIASNIMNILVLGPLAPKLTYPAYTSYSYIQVADFLDRAEILIYTLFIAINFIKMSISFYACSLCISKIFSIKDYRVVLVPLGILVVEHSLFIVRSQPEHINLITYSWSWYALIFHLVIPLTLLIVSIVKRRLKNA